MSVTYDFDKLYIETGRSCNIACEHCYYGPSEYRSMDPKIINKLFGQTVHIGCLYLTGGEPFLQSAVISHIISTLKLHHIAVNSFVTETNGMVEDYDVIRSLADLYAMSAGKNKCRLIISDDKYHRAFAYPFQYETTFVHVLDMLAFTRHRSSSEPSELYAEGRAAQNQINAARIIHDKMPVIDMIGTDTDPRIYVHDGCIYVNVNGGILTEPHYSYINQEDHTRGSLMQDDLDTIFCRMRKEHLYNEYSDR